MTSAPTLGSLLRAVRERHDWTLQEMSDRTGIPRSTLAKVEHDRLTLGYDKLLQISQRLKMRLSELISAGDDPEPRMMTRRSVGTIENALRVATPSYEYFFMCADLSRKKVIPIYGRVLAKSLEEFGELLRHAGEEFIFVTRGRVLVITEFYEPVTLETNQCMYIDSGMGHAYLLAPGCHEAWVVAGCTSDDDRLIDSLARSKAARVHESPQRTAEAVAEKAERGSSKAKSPRRGGARGG
jgi:transcriptional regulator with XRE-family HTH domain